MLYSVSFIEGIVRFNIFSFSLLSEESFEHNILLPWVGILSLLGRGCFSFVDGMVYKADHHRPAPHQGAAPLVPILAAPPNVANIHLELVKICYFSPRVSAKWLISN